MSTFEESKKMNGNLPLNLNILPSSPKYATFTLTSSETSNSEAISNKSSIEDETFVMKVLDIFFRNLGYFIADHPRKVLTVVLIFGLLTSLKVPFTKQEDDLKTGYTPLGARSYSEVAMYEEFNAKHGNDQIGLGIFIRPNDEKTLTRVEHLNATIDLLDFIGNNFTINGLNFYEFCTDFCEFNEPVRQFRNGLVIQTSPEYTIPEELFDSRMNLTFPFMSVFGRQLDLSPLFFGVKKFDNPENQRLANSTTNIENLPLIVLQLKADKPQNISKEDVSKWEREIEHYVHHVYQNDYIKPMIMTITFAADEIIRNGMTLFPFISVGFTTLVTFAIITVSLSAWYFDQWTVHKLSLAITGCICPLLATSSSLGFLFLFGFRFGTILAVTPFLILAIGVDDAFLMINSWQRICVQKRRLKQQNPNIIYTDELRDRIAEMFVDVGPSITITFATNVLAFVVDLFSPTPEITLFCTGNAVAIFFDYVFQFTIFGPIMIIAAEYEMKTDNERMMKSLANVKSFEKRKKLGNFMEKMLKKYCRWIADGFTFGLMVLVLIVYWIVSLRGALNINPSITPEKLFLQDSLVTKMNILRDTYILPNYTAINVFVNNVGNLSSFDQQNRIKNLINDYEKHPECLGKDYTHFWFRDYEKYLKTVENDEIFDSEDGNLEIIETDKYSRNGMETFLKWPEYQHWKGFIRFNDNGTLEKFFAVVAYHGNDMISWNHRANLLNEFRAIADNYSDLDAWVFVEDSLFLDQIETMVPNTIQSSAATLVCMAIICTIFMGNLFTTMVATLSILSICIGVFGFLAMWNIDLDPISMATTIMSIGFSVDFPAHASFHYYRTGMESGGKLTPEERILEVLTAIMYPLCQCGTSTILFVFCLLFVPSYMSEVFVKTMVLVISFGLIHGLFVIPVTLCAFSKIYNLLCAPNRPLHSAIQSLKSIKSTKKIDPNNKNVSKIEIHD